MSHRPVSESFDADFLTGLAAGLPDPGFWAAPSLVGVSGGADSVALFRGLCELAAARSDVQRLTVVHAWHDLRDNSAADAAFVERLAADWRVPCVVRRVEVRAGDGVRGEGVEARARRLRLACFAALAGEVGARFVVVAHTLDDQVETILHRALRGTGVGGLAGMARTRPLCDGVSLLRPLVTVARGAVREYLASRGQEWREDPSNADRRYARNFLRHEILPRCEAGPYPATREALVRLAGQAGVISGALRSAAEHLLELYVRRHADGTVAVRTGPLRGLDGHLITELFVALWAREAWPQRDMTAEHYTRLAALAAASLDAPTSESTTLPGGLRAAVEARGVLRIGPA